jgi:glyoxylase-like metal-dependent hydrolase (beta-lactamase superfamily II)
MVNVAKDDSIQIEKLELGPFGTNAYFLVCRHTGSSVLVDAPGEADKILAQLQGTDPKYILMTHNHMDHTGALAEVKSALNVPIAAHRDDAGELPLKPDMLLAEGDVIVCGDIQLEVLHTPGHTPGSLCFKTEKHLIAGDTLFPGGPGRTGSPADFRRLMDSLSRKIFVLPGKTRVYPGHGDFAILEKEKPLFEAFCARKPDLDICGDVLWSTS